MFNTDRSNEIKIRLNKCKHIYCVTSKNFLKRQRCPKCSNRNKSKGRKIIKNIDYKIEERFDRCADKELLPFYIFIADYNLVLQYDDDGKGHFHTFRFIKDVKERLKKLEENQKSVQIRNRYCIKNNISSIRIPYG